MRVDKCTANYLIIHQHKYFQQPIASPKPTHDHECARLKYLVIWILEPRKAFAI